MSDSVDSPDQAPAPQARSRRAIVPSTPVGWWALGLTMVAIASWVALPLLTINFRETYPITDTWVMPAIALVLTDLAAVFNVLCVWPWRERSILNIVATVLMVPAALFVTFMVVGEGLAGV
ncbi:MAG: hypothetical protein AB8I80_02280 [Anaerolineae bacterium]|jgi:hypothetical protein